MISLISFVAFALLQAGQARVVELKCADNATCIDDMAREFARSMKENKAVRLFDLITIEPIGGNRQARSGQDPLTRLITTHAISFDWNDFTFRFSNPEDRSDAMDLEVFENRSAKDVSDENPKKSKSKDEEVIENKKVKGINNRPIKRRRTRHKMMQAVIPLIFGMKSAGVVIFAMFMVSVITIKAFLASKMALLVTIGMAMKRLYESYGSGVGLQNHPYLYSQYPIDFPSASSHAYSVSGASQQFASPEMYSPTAISANAHSNDLIANDASAQQSQPAPTVVNTTQAAERWDGYRRRPIFYGTSRATSEYYSAFRNPH